MPSIKIVAGEVGAVISNSPSVYPKLYPQEFSTRYQQRIPFGANGPSHVQSILLFNGGYYTQTYHNYDVTAGALATTFDTPTGVDIAKMKIEGARLYYYVNNSTGFEGSEFESSRVVVGSNIRLRGSEYKSNTYEDFYYLTQEEISLWNEGAYIGATGGSNPYSGGWNYCDLTKSDVNANKLVADILSFGCYLTPFFDATKVEAATQRVLYISLGENGSSENTRPYLELEYEDINTKSIVSILSPASTVIESDEPNQFAWMYSQAMGAPQLYVDLQYMVDNAWEPVWDKEPFTEQTYMFSAGTFKSGSTTWRIRTWHSNGAQDIAGEWAQAQVTIDGPPDTPVITSVQSRPRPSMEWASANQTAYRVEVRVPDIDLAVYDSGTVRERVKNWTAPKYLDDGQYELRVQVLNSRNRWSDWASTIISVINHPGASINLAASRTENYGAKLSWQTEGDYSGYYVYRDGQPIMQTTKLSFVDYEITGKATYVVRGANGDNYTESNEDSVCCRVKRAVVSGLDNIDWVHLNGRKNEDPAHSIGYSTNVAFVHFERPPAEDGKQRPTMISGDEYDASHSFSFTAVRGSDYARLKKLLGKEVIYKDSTGERVYGCLDTISPAKDPTDARFVDFSFTIRETDVREVIPDVE